MTLSQKTLASGLKVVVDALPHVETAAVGVYVPVGTRNEEASAHGLSHLLEHMAFKGTATRSAREIAEEIEAVGGYLNAYTGYTETAYYARVLKEDVGLAIDLLGDILARSAFAPDELERERSVIIQEIRHAEETPDDIVFDHLQSVAFGGQALGRSVLGTAASVSEIAREDIVAYMKAHYTADRALLVATGAVEADEIFTLATRALGGLPATGPAPRHEPAIFTGGLKHDARDIEQLHLALGLPGVPITDERFFAQGALAEILGGGMSSRLFQKVREERGLAYSVYSFARSFNDGGLFGVYAGIDPENLETTLDLVVGEIEALTREVGPAELQRAKAQMKSALLRARETTGGRMEALAEDMLRFQRVVPVSEIVARIERVDEGTVRASAARLLRAGAPALAVVGAGEAERAFETSRRRFS
ncbi:MAG: insulinase family protein [Alphaproteobacteria bacterium]|nr:insulinase family protein [Alphaproteobacteria bacterium]